MDIDTLFKMDVGIDRDLQRGRNVGPPTLLAAFSVLSELRFHPSTLDFSFCFLISHQT